MYVAVKGGEKAILQSLAALDQRRRGDTRLPALTVDQIREQLPYAVDRVMAEGSLYDPELAALAIKQAGGDLIEAIFLLRAFRTTLPRLGHSHALDTRQMQVGRRISAIFKDLPGGQILGPSFDYTQRLLDFRLLGDQSASTNQLDQPDPSAAAIGQSGEATADKTPVRSRETVPGALELLAQEGLLEQPSLAQSTAPHDLTRDPLTIPASRSTRLQNLARGDEGFLLALGYSTQRGYAHSHPFVGDLRIGWIKVEIDAPEVPFPLVVGRLCVTECQMVNQLKGSSQQAPAFTQGYGLAVGHNERKAMAMALTDRALRATEFGEPVTAPAQSEEFVLLHSDSLEASGFVQHLKLPHYVDFQSELEWVRRMRADIVQKSPDEVPTTP